MKRERHISICIQRETFHSLTVGHATWEIEHVRHTHINIQEHEDNSWSDAWRHLNHGQDESEEE
jgi:hypothetical protein